MVKEVPIDLLHKDVWCAMLLWREADKHRDAAVRGAEPEEVVVYDHQLKALLNTLRAEIDKVREELCKNTRS